MLTTLPSRGLARLGYSRQESIGLGSRGATRRIGAQPADPASDCEMEGLSLDADYPAVSRTCAPWLRAREGVGTESPIGTERGLEVPSLGARRCHAAGPVRPYLMLDDLGSYEHPVSINACDVCEGCFACQ